MKRNFFGGDLDQVNDEANELLDYLEDEGYRVPYDVKDWLQEGSLVNNEREYCRWKQDAKIWFANASLFDGDRNAEKLADNLFNVMFDLEATQGYCA
tara:strand:- start:2522 stop:2812 length:291 start_codon:yes stop_codon:yes gene_type:complete